MDVMDGINFIPSQSVREISNRQRKKEKNIIGLCGYLRKIQKKIMIVLKTEKKIQSHVAGEFERGRQGSQRSRIYNAPY